LVPLAILFGTATPALPKVYLKIGIMDEPKTLNPIQASDRWSKKVIMPIYQHLYIREPDTLELIPWIAEDKPIYDSERKTVTFHLKPMQWDDGTEFRAEDVVFTAEVFKKFHIPRYYEYWKYVKKIEALDNRTVQLTLEKPSAILYTRTLTTWVVQKSKWEPIIRNAENKLKEAIEQQTAKGMEGEKAIRAALKEPLKMIQNHAVKKPTGLGPFKFNEWKKGAYIHLTKNDRFFGMGKSIAGRKLGPFVDGILFKIYGTTDAAILALKKGDIDFFWWGVSAGYVSDLTKDSRIQLQMTLENGYRYFAFNLRKMPMSDIAFRKAVAYLVDKDFIVKRIAHDYAERLDSVIPPGDPFYFNPKTPTYGKGMDRSERTRVAYRIMTEAGYRWKRPPIDSKGKVQKADGLMMPGGATMPPLTILTPPADYDPERAFAGQFIQEWLRDFGVPVYWKPLAFGALIQKIRKERQFDMFVMGWGSLPLDPDYLRRFFHSKYDRPNGWNYMGYRNGEFDRLAELQAETMNLEERREIVFKLQDLIMNDLPYVPLFVPFNLEGIRTDRYEGWTKMLGGIGNSWTLSHLKPIKQLKSQR
jgi:ABC-type transport system substrate-binding protein